MIAVLKDILDLTWMAWFNFFYFYPATIPEKITKLPEVVQESSGLYIGSEKIWWTHNDSGHEAELFAFDPDGSLIHVLNLQDATNIDWEDLADNKCDLLFIGDFGNNLQIRKDLKIYRLNLSDPLQQPIEKIHFHYPDQTEFPARGNFDMEAFIFFQDSLYLFSKNNIFWSNGYSKIYSLPSTPGTYEANLLDSFYTKTPVTGADLSPSGETIALISYGKILFLYDFSGPPFLDGKKKVVTIPISQTEAIAFLNDHTVIITNEEGYVFRMDITPFLDQKK